MIKKRILCNILALLLLCTAVLTNAPLNIATASDTGVIRVHFFESTGEYEPDGREYLIWYWMDGSALAGTIASYKKVDGRAVKSDLLEKDDNSAVIFELILPVNAVNAIKAGKRVGMVIPRADASGKPDWGAKDVNVDRYFFPTLNENNECDIFVFKGDKNVYLTLESAIDAFNQIQFAQWADVTAEISQGDYSTPSFDTVRFTISVPLDEDKHFKASLYRVDEMGNNVLVQDAIPQLVNEENSFVCYARFSLMNEEKFDFTAQYKLGVEAFKDLIYIDMTRLLPTVKFSNLYTYNGNDLGATYTKTSTKFKVWSPFASRVMLNLYSTGNPEDGQRYTSPSAMTMDANGVWSCEAMGDLNGVYYTYSVVTYGTVNEVVDIYAKTAGVNGERGMVVDLASTNPAGWENDSRLYLSANPEHRANVVNPVIWEVHVRDFSIHPDSGMKYKGKYLAFTEQDTTLRGNDTIKTGINYLKELGITYVHILPMYDQASVDEEQMGNIEFAKKFNWGYDPKNYNMPEGSYSTDPSRGEVRVNELKQMVMSLHEAGIGVIMDVVYNHTASSSGSFFDMTVPGYYYRQAYNADAPYGKFSDGSGCGNETASERAMFRKFMRDSLAYLAEEYHLDGFRFDLMQLHDRTTMNYIRSDMDALDGGEGKKILLYGEPWAAAGSPNPEPTSRDMLSEVDGVGGFSDVIRKGIKGEDSGFDGGYVSAGYISGNANGSYDAVLAGIKGISWDNFNVNSPAQMINYASAHDNHTLYDHINKIYKGTYHPSSITYIIRDEGIVRTNKLGAGIYLLAKGIPFIHAGEEVARTKLGNHNSYNSPDHINQFDWRRTEEYQDLFNYYRDLIEIRKRFSNLRDVSATSYSNFVELDVGNDARNAGVIGYAVYNYAYDSSNWDYLVVIHNPADYDVWVNLSLKNGFGGTVKAYNSSELYCLTQGGEAINFNSSARTGQNGMTVSHKGTAVLVQKR